MTVVHKYKGFEIEKREDYYSQGCEIYYVIKGIKNKTFPLLRDAKHYIDKEVIL